MKHKSSIAGGGVHMYEKCGNYEFSIEMDHSFCWQHWNVNSQYGDIFKVFG